MKVLFTAPVGERSYAEISKNIKSLGYEIERMDEFQLEDEVTEVDCDILICYDPFKKISFRKAKSLKAVITVSAGVDQVPQYILDNEEIQIINNNGAYSVPIAEWIVMCILMGMKNYPELLKKQRAKKWELQRDVLECQDMRVLFLGAGKIAKAAAERLKVFGVQTVAYRKTRKANPNFDETIFDDGLEEELKRADAIVVALPDTDETKGFVDAKKIGLMREDAIFINIARGVIVDELALKDALKAGKFRMVALDVAEEEPLAEDSELWDLDRLFLTPHTSWISQLRPWRMNRNIMENLESFMKTGKLVKEINRRQKY